MPAGFAHAYKIEEAARMMGTLSGGFERFFQHMGTVTDHPTTDQPPFIPDFPRMQAAAQQHNMQFFPPRLRLVRTPDAPEAGRRSAPSLR